MRISFIQTVTSRILDPRILQTQPPATRMSGPRVSRSSFTIARMSVSSLSALLLLAACAASLSAHAQQNQAPSPPVPTLPGVSANPTPAEDPTLHRMAEQMAIKRSAQRQQQIVSDSARLLALAQKLSADVSKSDKNELSISVVKDAGEIEKLAKSIKDKMRDGD